jgi:hypothetical protein
VCGRKETSVKVVKVVTERHILLTMKLRPQCGKRFMGMKIQQYCAKVCAKKAVYHRNPEAYRESRMRSYRKSKGQDGEQK